MKTLNLKVCGAWQPKQKTPGVSPGRFEDFTIERRLKIAATD
jgi:hypothetical protein